MAVRSEVVRIISFAETHSIPVNRTLRKEADARVELHRSRWEAARKEQLMQRLTNYYGVAIFGSARLQEDAPEFQFVTEISKSLVTERPIDIVTGGGPGIMLAAHKGAKEAIQDAANNGIKIRARTHGIRIALPFEELPNEHIDVYTSHSEFSTRLQEFIDKTQGAYIAPGGYGTLLELAMVLQLKQAGHLEEDYPLLAHPFWKPMFDMINSQMYDERHKDKTPYIDEKDKLQIEFTDNVSRITDRFVRGYDKWERDFKSRKQNLSISSFKNE